MIDPVEPFERRELEEQRRRLRAAQERIDALEARQARQDAEVRYGQRSLLGGYTRPSPGLAFVASLGFMAVCASLDLPAMGLIWFAIILSVGCVRTLYRAQQWDEAHGEGD